MKAQLTISQGEIETAVRDHVQRNGWRADKVQLKITRGYDGDDPREPGSPDTVAAVIDVEPIKAQP